MGVPLFERAGNSIKPTAIATLISERAAQVLSLADRIDDEVQEHIQGLRGVLRIGYGPATRIHPLPSLLRAIEAAYPQIRLVVKQAVGAPLAAGVQNGEFDIAVSYSGNALSFGDLIRTNLFSDRMVILASPNHSIHNQPILLARDFLRYPFASMGIVDPMVAMFGNLSPIEHDNLYAFVCDNTEIFIPKILAGSHIGIGPRFLFKKHLDDGSLREVPYEWNWHSEFWMITRKETAAIPIVRSVIEMAKKLSFSCNN